MRRGRPVGGPASRQSGASGCCCIRDCWVNPSIYLQNVPFILAVLRNTSMRIWSAAPNNYSKDDTLARFATRLGCGRTGESDFGCRISRRIWLQRRVTAVLGQCIAYTDACCHTGEAGQIRAKPDADATTRHPHRLDRRICCRGLAKPAAEPSCTCSLQVQGGAAPPNCKKSGRRTRLRTTGYPHTPARLYRR